MATVCHSEAIDPADPFLAQQLQRREALVHEAGGKGLGAAFDVWRREWEAIVAVADLACTNKGRMAADLRDWNDRLEAALKEYR